MKKTEKCPYCGSTNFVEGKQDGYATMGPNKLFSIKSQAIFYIICLDCGTIVRSYVKNPKKLIID